MANVPSQHQPQPESAYSYQQQQYGEVSYYMNNGSTQQPQWNGQSCGYNYNQAGSYDAGGMSYTNSTASVHQTNYWNNTQNASSNPEYYTQPAPVVTNGNHLHRSKRCYANFTSNSSAVGALHDITNQCQVGNQRKRRKIVAASNKPANGVQQPQQGRPVRIESIFRHVELLAQSYWQTKPTLKPATVEALETNGQKPGS